MGTSGGLVFRKRRDIGEKPTSFGFIMRRRAVFHYETEGSSVKPRVKGSSRFSAVVFFNRVLVSWEQQTVLSADYRDHRWFHLKPMLAVNFEKNCVSWEQQ